MEDTRNAGHRQVLGRFRKGKKTLYSAAAVVALALGVVLPAAPASAVGMMTVHGNISCTAYPNITIGTTATARGQVQFQLNQWNNTGVQGTVNLGYSAAYAPWGWKWWNNAAGNFYAIGYETIGNVTAINRYCQSI